MTYGDYCSYFKWRADLLMSGRYDDLANQYAIPVQIGLDDTTFVIEGHDSLIVQLHRLRVALNDRGIVRLEPRVLAVELPRKVQRVWVQWQGFGADGCPGITSETIYHLERSNGEIRSIGLMNTRPMVPEFAQASYRNRLVRARR